MVDALDRSIQGSGVLGVASDFDPSLTSQEIGRVEVVWFRGGPQAARCRAAGGTAELTAVVLLAGRARLTQADRVAELEEGDLCLIRTHRPLELSWSSGAEMALVKVPEQEFADSFPSWRLAVGRRIASDGGVPAVFLDAVRSLQRWRETLDAPSVEGLANALIDLLGAVICFAVPASSDCVVRSLYHRERVKRFARMHLRNPELDVELIANGVNLSSRQIHRLFANEPMSLMRWIWVQRLESCHRELRDAASARRSISEIAYAWGFNNHAHFSRAFRRHFGISPREARGQGRGDGSCAVMADAAACGAPVGWAEGSTSASRAEPSTAMSLSGNTPVTQRQY
ncbi:helix-turn-helix domain-containing protein [Thioalkalicoccus limnaeus]|uniref:Helix-turn-helix domain-containing protein n=1 Tax=Thioalkalicoccus limnaeus TaxID=120681 RepID=A0ABV4BCR1_9GAMM